MTIKLSIIIHIINFLLAIALIFHFLFLYANLSYSQ